MPLSLAPSESRNLAIDIALPPEPGEYNIYVSVMREHVAWFYNEGWPFLLIDVLVDDSGHPKLLGWRIADKRSVARRRMKRSVSRAFSLPLESIWRNRNLIRTLVRRDVLSRYSGSFGGAFWAVLNPLMLMLTYFFVFGLVLQSRFGNDASHSAYAVYFLAGMLPWLAFSEAVGRSPFIMVEHRGFIKKLLFPVETLPVNLVVSGLVTEFFGIILFALALLLVRGRVPRDRALSAGAGDSADSAHGGHLLVPRRAGRLRSRPRADQRLSADDLVFPHARSAIPKSIWTSCRRSPCMSSRMNPIFVLVRGYRSILLDSKAPDWTALAWLTAASILVFLLGHAWFYKLRKSFADLI